MLDVIYQDKRIFVAIKPAGVLSTDEPGGMPELIRDYLGAPQGCVRTVHRLDRVVSGLMVYARSVEASRRLSTQMQSRTFHKEYLAVVHGRPEEPQGTMQDLLLRQKETRTTVVTDHMEKGVQEAVLHYQVLASREDLSLVKIQLETGRTHQIRVQFSSRGFPLVGDRKYGIPDQGTQIALWSHHISFTHPETGEPMDFSALPPDTWPWSEFLVVDKLPKI
jgi:23S rRNA pseudouridine1911/1915/1917 synthase